MESYGVFEVLNRLTNEELRRFNPSIRCYVNKEKRTLSLYFNNDRVIIRCDVEDEFDEIIGLGLALSNMFDTIKYRKHRKYFRNKKTRQLNYKKYATWVVQEFFNCDLLKINSIKSKLKSLEKEEYVAFDLDGGLNGVY